MNLAALACAVQRCLEQYDLVVPDEPVVLALSGGKDSMVLGMALRHLGIPFLAVTVDVGHEPGWGSRVKDLARAAGIETQVVSLRKPQQVLDPRIRTRLEILDAGMSEGKREFTPCTYCHGAKLIALQEIGAREGLRRVAVGQHATDAVASLLKEGLLQVDAHAEPGTSFSMARFRDRARVLAEEIRTFPDQEHPLLDAIGSAVYGETLDTDDPPRQALHFGTDVELIRPMFLVRERDIVSVRDASALGTMGSGCHHGLAEETYTPRELIHYGILREIDNPEFDVWIDRLVLHGVRPDGAGRVASRLRRSELLGVGYKGPQSGHDKYGDVDSPRP
jgi:hypothetical protein